MRLKLTKLEVFAIVAEEGSFSAAAERLHLSQPAISRHMLELETVLGIRLFKRLRRGVALTRGGEILHDYTRRILWLVGEAEGALTDVTQLTMGKVNLGATPGVSVYLLPAWAQSFMNAYPNLTVRSTTGTTGEVVESLMTGRCDMGAVEGELDNWQNESLGYVVLQDIDLALVVGPEHEWWEADSITIQQLDGAIFITRQPDSRTRVWIDTTLKAQGIEPRLVAEFDNPEAIKEAVMNGAGATILPTYAFAREAKAGFLRAVPIADLTLKRQVKLLWDADRPLSPVARAFMAHLAELFPALVEHVPQRELALEETDA